MQRDNLSKKKRFFFRTLVFGALVVFVEMAAFLAYWAMNKTFFSYDRLQEQRQNLTTTEEGGAVSAARTPNARLESFKEILHPYLGYVGDPSRAPVSNYGFWDSKPLVQKRSDDKVIVGIFGGSVAWFFARGEGVSELEKELLAIDRFEGKEIVFLFLAIPGYKQPQQLMALNYILALGGEFDIVINIDGFNEVALHPKENALKGVAAIYPREWYYRVQTLPNIQLIQTAGEIHFLREKRRHWGQFVSSSPLRFSVTGNLIWKLCDTSLIQAINERITLLSEFQSTDDMPIATGPKKTYETNYEMFRDLAAIWGQCSIQMARLCDVNGIRYIQFLQPNQYVPGSKDMGTEEKARAFRERGKYRDSVVQGYPLLFREGLKAIDAGVDLHDLTMLFSETKDPRYIDVCCHFDEEGLKMMANQIAISITRQYEEDKDGLRASRAYRKGFVDSALPTRISRSVLEVTEKGTLYLRGWVASPQVIDRVEVHCAGEALEPVEFPTRRVDVLKNVPEYRTEWCGYVLELPYESRFSENDLFVEVFSGGVSLGKINIGKAQVSGHSK